MGQPESQSARRAVSRARRPGGACLLALLLVLAAIPAWAQAEEAATEQTPAAIPAQDPAARWLDEVRAQRQAWEERRKASREAFEARRRLADPRGAAQHDAWEDEVERRREARRQQREQELEHFRGLGPPDPPWRESMAPWGYPPQTATPPSAPPPLGAATADGQPSEHGEPPPPGIIYPPGAPPRGPYSPQDWDNLWYYRGY
ncbi:MAG: hypothetical protein ACM3ST_11290 [Bdellovibrio bacteriovorus]